MYAIIDASANNIPGVYGTGPGSLILDGAPSGGVLSVSSTCSEIVTFTITSHPTEVPDDSTSSNTAQWACPASPAGGGATITLDMFKVAKGDRIFIKSNGSDISSGKVILNIK